MACWFAETVIKDFSLRGYYRLSETFLCGGIHRLSDTFLCGGIIIGVGGVLVSRNYFLFPWMHCLCPKQLDHTLGRGGTWGAYMAVLSVVMKVTLSVCVQALCMVAIARDLYCTLITTACVHLPRGNV